MIPVRQGMDSNIVLTLHPTDVRHPEVVVNGEDPAYPLIRKAIIRKKLIRKK